MIKEQQQNSNLFIAKFLTKWHRIYDKLEKESQISPRFDIVLN
jgi:hypothetical protein